MFRDAVIGYNEKRARKGVGRQVDRIFKCTDCIQCDYIVLQPYKIKKKEIIKRDVEYKK